MRIIYAVGDTSETSIPVDWAAGFEQRGHVVSMVSAGDGRLSFFARLQRAVERRQPDIVHCHHTLPALGGVVLRAGRPRFGIVLTVHRLMSDMSISRLTAHLAGGLCMDKIVANSRATRDSFPRMMRRSGDRLRVIYNGVDFERLDRARPDQEDGREESLRVISVGRLICEKGFDVLLGAFALVREKLSRPVTLTIVGEGPARRQLEERARLLEVREWVTFTGQLERERVYALLWRADVFALSSQTEGFCNAVVEAMGARLPVVVTPAGALPEVVGSNAWIASGTSTEYMAEALLGALRSDPRRRRAVGEAGAQRARRLYSMGRMFDRYEALYSRLAAGRNE